MYPYYMSVEFDSYGSMLNHPTTKGQHTHIKRLNGLQKETQPKKAQKYDEKIRKTPLWDFFSPPWGMTAQTLRHVLKVYQETNER